MAVIFQTFFICTVVEASLWDGLITVSNQYCQLYYCIQSVLSSFYLSNAVSSSVAGMRLFFDIFSGYKTQLWLGTLDERAVLIRYSTIEYYILYCVISGTLPCLYLDERRGVQGNTNMRLREFPRAEPEETPDTECWYFSVLPNSSQGTNIIQFINLMKL